MDSTPSGPHVPACHSLTDAQQHVGTEIYRSDWERLSQQRIDQFAQATGDFQWIHVDPERARRESPFGQTVAHGFFTLALLGKYYAQFLDRFLPGSDRTLNYGLNRVRFTQPVCAGQRVRGRFTLRAAQARDMQQWQLTFDVIIDIDGQDRPACVAESIVLCHIASPEP